MSDLTLFLPITKVDVDQRLVYGLATAEIADRDGEICDYASTRPLYEAWSAQINEASGGKSLGALRAMHGKIAAGKLTDIAFDDANKRIMIAAKIVDDDEWNKVVEGVYTGFSQGGRYVRRWPDPDNGLTRYTAEPREISLVDVPCLPEATFEVVKDGVSRTRAFVVRDAGIVKEATVEAADEPEDETPPPVGDRINAFIALVTEWSERIGAAARAMNDNSAPPIVVAGPPAPPVDKAAESPVSEALEKALAETAALRTQFAQIAPEFLALAARVHALESQPAPARAALRAVAKAEESSSVDQAVRRLAALDPDERALALMKISLANPISPRF